MRVDDLLVDDSDEDDDDVRSHTAFVPAKPTAGMMAPEGLQQHPTPPQPSVQPPLPFGSPVETAAISGYRVPQPMRAWGGESAADPEEEGLFGDDEMASSGGVTAGAMVGVAPFQEDLYAPLSLYAAAGEVVPPPPLPLITSGDDDGGTAGAASGEDDWDARILALLSGAADQPPLAPPPEAPPQIPPTLAVGMCNRLL